MTKETDRYLRLIDAVEAERKEEEQYFKSIQSKKSIKEKIEAGIMWHPVIIVKKYFTIGELVEIIIERKKEHQGPHRFKSGVGCQLSFKADKEITIPAVVSFIKRNRMGIICNGGIHELSDIPDHARASIEVIYDERPYRIMKQTLSAVINSQEEHIIELREGIRVKGKFEYFQSDQSQQYFIESSLNESQIVALKGSVQSKRLSIIHGPPGTGKTTTLVALVRQLLTTEKKILVCAPSNNAVDLLARQLDQSGVNTLRIGNVTRVGDSIAHLTLAQKAADHIDWKHIKKVKIEANEARKHASSFRRKFGAKERANRNAMYKESRDLMKWARDLEDRLISNIINGSEAICSTLIGVSHRVISAVSFDTVIIDEASQALEPECWNAILKAKRVILAGDYLQLPPTIKSKEAKKLGLEETLLDRMTSVIDSSYLLNTQYRMNDKILSFSNSQFYDSQLESAEGIGNHHIDDHPLVLIDTSGTGFEEKTNPDSKSRYNEGEHFIIREWFIKHKDILTDCSIGIISPYAEQVRYLRSKKEEEDAFRDLDIEVNTIDGFQGQEKDVIIISLVRSNDTGEIGFLKDERRLNVAMTRARKKLIIIGDLSTLSGSELFENLAAHVEAHGQYQSAWEYMGV